jgi:hypothetical protein
MADIDKLKRNVQTLNMGKLFGIKDLNPDEAKMYYEIINEGGETTPKWVRQYYPDKNKATLKIKGLERKKKNKKTKAKRKTKDCGCK